MGTYVGVRRLDYCLGDFLSLVGVVGKCIDFGRWVLLCDWSSV